MPPCLFSAGIDASDFDWGRGPMDLGAAVRDGIVFFTHKATEGTRTRHLRYGEALNRARAAGMPLMGAYIVPRTPGSYGHGTIPQQVAYALTYLDAQTPWWRSTPQFFLQVDTEHWGYDNVAPQHGAQMAALLRAQTGKWVVHYAPRWAYGDTIPGGEPLWASSYGTNPAVPYRQGYPGDNSSGWVPYSGRTPTFLQYGSRLTIGSQPGCDGNAFRGSLDQLRALITGGSDMTQPIREAINADTYLWHLAQGSDPITGIIGQDGRKISVANVLGRTLGGIAGDVLALKAAIAQVLAAQGAAQADIDALLAKPAVTLGADQVTQLGADLAAVLVAHPDTPLGEADIPAMTAALDRYFRTHFGQPE